MLPRLVGIVSGLVLTAGVLLAQAMEATIVSYDKETMKLVVTDGGKEKTWQLGKKTHVHYPEGDRIKEVSLKDRPNYLKKGVRVSIEEEDGKLVEINIIAAKKKK